MQTRLRIGTRGSKLALVQTETAIAALATANKWSPEEAAAKTEVVIIQTTGDRVQDRPLADIGGKGLFAKEIEQALLSGEIDCAVHSLKDMPTFLPPGLIIDCVLPREDPRDAFISNIAQSLNELPLGSTIGSSSVRRRAMLAHARPDLKLVQLRGNVDTRLQRIAAGEPEAAVLAFAGLKRLGAESRARHIFSDVEMLPAAAQGAVGIELRAADSRTRETFAPVNHRESALAVLLERSFLEVLDGSCKTPIAGLANWTSPGAISFKGCALSLDGKMRYDVTRAAGVSSERDAVTLGRDAGSELLERAGRSFFQV